MTAAEDPKSQSDVCPKCGGRLRFARAPGGSGQTLEVCENLRLSTVRPGVNVGSCDHWRMLEVIRHPAHTRAPRVAEPKRSRPRATPRSTGLRAATESKILRVLESLDDSSARAQTKDEVAQALGIPVENAYRYLEILASDGRACVQFRSRGQRHRRPKEYWRARVAEAA